MKRPGIIKDSSSIKEALRNRFKELNLSYSDVSRDAKKRKMPIAIESISRYFSKKDVAGSLSEEHIIWLSFRYGVYISMNVGVPKLVEGKIQFSIPPYNEERNLELLKRFFKTKKKAKA